MKCCNTTDSFVVHWFCVTGVASVDLLILACLRYAHVYTLSNTHLHADPAWRPVLRASTSALPPRSRVCLVYAARGAALHHTV